MSVIDITFMVFAVVILLVQWRMNLLEKKVNVLINKVNRDTLDKLEKL